MKLSYCTTCHNRLWQLEQTIEHNIKFTKPGEIDIVILFYNDEEGYDKFSSEYKHYIDDGRVKVFNHLEDKVFKDGKRWSCGYTKDIIHRLAEGRVLFNLDTDNFIDEPLQEVLLGLQPNEMVITLQREWSSDGRSGRIGICKERYGDVYYEDNGNRDDLEFMNQGIAQRLRFRQMPCQHKPISNTPSHLLKKG